MFLGSCSSFPFRDDPRFEEVNLAFTLDRNLIRMSTVTIDGRYGHFILGSAQQRTVLDSRFAGRRANHVVQLTEKETTRISPHRADLSGLADAIVGTDTWRSNAISIDYHTGLVTYQKEGIKPGLMKVYRYPSEPAVEVVVDGRTIQAIVDTSSPDTLVLPSNTPGRGAARVSVAGTDFGTIDVKYASTARPRIGNRLLSHFLVSIDYGRRLVGLWHDPRNHAT